MCIGGTQAGQACRNDTQCPGGECGAALFAFAERLLDGVGPVVLRPDTCLGGTNALAPWTCPGGQCASVVAQALDPVPLDGLIETLSMFALVREEAIERHDLNGDGDATDHVVTLVDRTTGQSQPIGSGGAPGRAVARIQQPPFSFPAVAAEGDVVAFLESETAQGERDENGNGAVFDTILRVFGIDGHRPTELTTGTSVTADADPLIDGRCVEVSGGLVFFRTREASLAHQTTTVVPIDSPNVSRHALSADARHLARTQPSNRRRSGAPSRPSSWWSTPPTGPRSHRSSRRPSRRGQPGRVVRH